MASPQLSLSEQAVLGLLAEGPSHGFALARLLDVEGEVGRIYAVPRPVVYRSLDRLTASGLAHPGPVEAGQRGPQRTPVRITPKGRKVHNEFLNRPVEHVREMRTELLLKLAFLERSGAEWADLVRAQQETLEPIVAALGKNRKAATGIDQVILGWRLRSAQAAQRFLSDLL